MDSFKSGEKAYLWCYLWRALAAFGGCDHWGSVECCRVTAEWDAAGQPFGIAEFILLHSNLSVQENHQ